MSRFTFYSEDSTGDGTCGVCLEVIGRQSTPPEVKFEIDKESGKGVWYICCAKCLRQRKENELAEAAAKKHEEQQKLVTAGTVPTGHVREHSKPNGKSNKRTAKKRRAK